ncbi:DUF1707 domain-containing protein [Micromonospora craniellae]|uniref:DUF1707 domain-containing protein n=1 Tax=Micromonospora craniellae TaxID=2294034 RepID=A0A372G6C1_9ACTN|nr:DUF1707 domain-containing protein [Micromonospora craniellae]RFS48543.1 DUF1707 domain-containing protein [Micromonospora craniellae]
MRAANSDRQAVAERLRAALDEGRLDLHEYDERLQRAYAARTYAELAALTGDLPGAVPARQEPDSPVLPDGGRGVTVRWLVDVWEPWLRTVGIVVAIWAVTSFAARDLLYFWPIWVAGPWGAVQVVRTVTGLSTGEPQRWAAQQERRRQRRAEKKARKRERAALAAEQSGEIAATAGGPTVEPSTAAHSSTSGGGSVAPAGGDRVPNRTAEVTGAAQERDRPVTGSGAQRERPAGADSQAEEQGTEVGGGTVAER